MDTIEKHNLFVKEMAKTRPTNMVAEYMKAYPPPPWPEHLWPKEPVKTGVETSEEEDVPEGFMKPSIEFKL